MPSGFYLLLAGAVLLLGACGAFAAPPPSDPLMHVCEPADAGWNVPLPQPTIPPPPKNVGLKNPRALRKAPLLSFDGDNALAAEAVKPGGWVRGAGTDKNPYAIRDLEIRGVTTAPAILIQRVSKPLVIENVLVEGTPTDEMTPADSFGISIIDSDGVVIRRCRVSRCDGIFGGGAGLKNLRVEQCYLFSCRRSIMTSGGSHCSATGNYVRDAVDYGIFLYNGTDHAIENNYVMWTGREGIGTNGNAHRARYRNNVILHTGWTAVNVEGHVDDCLVEGNLVVDSHYGIILMGNRTACRKNQVFYCSQMGISVYSNKDIGNAGISVTDNQVVGAAQSGIDVMAFSSDVRITGNRVWQSETGLHVTGPRATIEKNDVYRFFKGIDLSAPGYSVRNNQVYGGRNGVWVEGVAEAGGIIAGNDLKYLLGGFILKGARGVTIEKNILFAVGQPMPIHECSGIVVRENDVAQIRYTGIALYNSTGCTVEKNRLRSGIIDAIRLDRGSGHTITGNAITAIKGEFNGGGILLLNTRDNRLTGNLLERCGPAITFSGKENRGNTLKDNRYQGNKQQIVMQQGATEIEKSNTLDAPAEARK
ncbi:MAG: right-handed parallel beta-helix repeat-containing protein [Armatimonadota bacterium]